MLDGSPCALPFAACITGYGTSASCVSFDLNGCDAAVGRAYVFVDGGLVAIEDGENCLAGPANFAGTCGETVGIGLQCAVDAGDE